MTYRPACFVLGAEQCLEMMARVSGGGEAVIVTSEFEVVMTPGIVDRMRWNIETENGFLPH